MKKSILIILMTIMPLTIFSTSPPDQKTEVMVLGSFHFNYPGRDAHVTKKKHKADVMSEQRQKELTEVVECLKKFKPTKVMIESNLSGQHKVDKKYNAYVKGMYKLKRDEREQLGYRIAKELGHKKVYCINVMSGDIDRYLKNRDGFFKKLEEFYKNGTYKKSQKEYVKFYESNSTYLLNNSLRDYYLRINSKENIDKMQGAYFLNTFHWELKKNDYAGTDWQCARWNNRNMRIFRNISRYTEKGDRILIIYGNGHHAHLRDYIHYSPFHKYVSPVKYLKK